MGMAVMMGVLGRGHFFHGDHAAFYLSTTRVLELDSGVGNLEMLFEDMIELDQDAVAF